MFKELKDYKIIVHPKHPGELAIPPDAVFVDRLKKFLDKYYDVLPTYLALYKPGSGYVLQKEGGGKFSLIVPPELYDEYDKDLDPYHKLLKYGINEAVIADALRNFFGRPKK